jgi:hypothetical protein
MDDVVELEYDVLYREFSDQYELRYWLDQYAEELQGATGLRVRTDARYLLLINFAEMVIRPADRAKKVPPREFREVVRDDMRTVLGAAAEQARRVDAREISGHQIINALPNVWGRLKTMAYNVWD